MELWAMQGKCRVLTTLNTCPVTPRNKQSSPFLQTPSYQPIMSFSLLVCPYTPLPPPFTLTSLPLHLPRVRKARQATRYQWEQTSTEFWQQYTSDIHIQEIQVLCSTKYSGETQRYFSSHWWCELGAQWILVLSRVVGLKMVESLKNHFMDASTQSYI